MLRRGDMAEGESASSKPASGGTGWGKAVVIGLVLLGGAWLRSQGKKDGPSAASPAGVPSAGTPVAAGAPAGVSAPVGHTPLPDGGTVRDYGYLLNPDPGIPVQRASEPQVGRRRCPQEALGWERSKCVFCRTTRTRDDVRQFSDSDGFGFCSDCGECANAFASKRAGASDPQTERLAKLYLDSVGNRYPLQVTTFMQWGNNTAWREAWHNMAVLTVPGYSEER
jgi:hypothetical protein